MVQINFALKEVNCKIVYYGPGMSGKTTNLEIVHRKAPTANKGDLTSIATEGDRTLFFDFMPLDLGNIAGMRTKFQLYTVPGQVYYNSTRKLVLQGVDGIIFVADSQADKMDENLESLENLRNNLLEYGKAVDQIPTVIQYNKRDMPTALSVEDLQAQLNPQGHPHFEAIATTGEGVFPTLKALSARVLESLSREKRKAGAPPRRKTKPAPEPVPAGAAAAAAATGPAPTVPPRSPPQPTPTEPRPAAPMLEPNPAPLPAAAAPPGPPPRPQRPAASASAPVPQTPVPQAPAQTGGMKLKPSAPPRRAGTGGTTKPAKIRLGGGLAGVPNDSALARPERRPEPVADSKPRPTAPKPPKIQKFVLEEDRGSPVLLIALAFIILVAVGVILYSFKIV